MSSDDTQLPVASGSRVRRVVLAILRRHRAEYVGVAVLAALAAVAGLVGPFVVGRLVQSLTVGGDPSMVAALCLAMLVAVVFQTVFTGLGTRLTMVLGEKIFATLRDDFMRDVTAVPISVVESAGTGDLLTRTTADIDAVATTVRFAVPQLAAQPRGEGPLVLRLPASARRITHTTNAPSAMPTCTTPQKMVIRRDSDSSAVSSRAEWWRGR